LGGFFRGLTVSGGGAVWGSCSGGSVCPVPNGSMFTNELLICSRQPEKRSKFTMGRNEYEQRFGSFRRSMIKKTLQS